VLGLAVLTVLVAACGGGGSADGWVSVGTGDTYGEWELFVEANDGAWTGCMRLEPGPTKRCTDPSSNYERWEDGDGVAFGVAPEDGTLEFADGGKVQLIEPDGIDRSFFVVADDAEVRVSG
jgi:hypothetical protein